MLDSTDIRFIIVLGLIIIVPNIMYMHIKKNIPLWKNEDSLKRNLVKVTIPFLVILPIINQLLLFGISNAYMWKITVILIIIAILSGYSLCLFIVKKSNEEE